MLSQDKTRLSVNGWFHGRTEPRPPRYIEPPRPLEPYKHMEVQNTSYNISVICIVMTNTLSGDPCVPVVIVTQYEFEVEI